MLEYNIESFTPEKRKLRNVMTMFNLFMSKNKRKAVHEQLEYSGSPIVQVLHKVATDNISSISTHTRMSTPDRHSDNRYQEILYGIVEFFINIYNTDTAYGDIVDAMLLDMFQPENAEIILTYLEQYQPDIKKCYFNIWEKTKQDTRDKEKDGILQRGQLCEDEMLLVNSEIMNKVKHTKKQLGLGGK